MMPGLCHTLMNFSLFNKAPHPSCRGTVTMTLPEVATLRCAQTGKQVMFQAWGCLPGRVQLYLGLQKAAE